MCAEIGRSRFINDKAKEAERNYPGRFIGAAHVHPLGGAESFRELGRCSAELGFQGVVITSEVGGLFLDAPEFEPFWAAASRLEMYVFVHPALGLNDSRQFDAYDTARSVGREFSLIMATIRLINSGVLDRHPNLTIQMAHLSGGIASLLGRIRSYQDKVFWATEGNSRHGVKPLKDFDYYLRERLVRIFKAANMRRIGIGPDNDEIVVHHVAAVDAKAVGDELVLADPVVDQQRIGVAARADRKRLASADRDDMHPQAAR